MKKELLQILKTRSNQWVSGESVSIQLKVTRSAIWKHIQKLREQGYEIQSAPKLGYCLKKAPEKPIPEEIREGLLTRVFGQKELLYYHETDSTNRVAKDLALENAPEGSLVIAEKQTQGRGRLGRQWFSPSEAGIYISFILRPSLTPQEAPKLTLLTAVAALQALAAVTGLAGRIKWPNDLFMGGKKVAGILTEISSDMDRIHHVVIGIGMNVNTASFPDPLQETATSLFLQTGIKWSRTRIVQEYLTRFEMQYDRFKTEGFGPVLEEWKESCAMIGRPVQVSVLNEQYQGIVQDIDRDGALILKDQNNKIQRIICGDVSLQKGVYA